MSSEKKQEISKDEPANTQNTQNNHNNNNSDNINDNPANNNCLTNDEYINLFYNSNNAGVNKNFPLKVVHETYKNKNEKKKNN